MGFNPEHDLLILCDNTQTVNLLSKEDPQLQTKLHYIDIYHHWLCQEVQANRITIDWIEMA